MRRFVEGVDRGQTALFPECLEDWIGQDNPVRVVDVFVEELDLAELPDQNCYASTLPAKRFYNANITVTLKGRLRVSAAEGVRPLYAPTPVSRSLLNGCSRPKSKMARSRSCCEVGRCRRLISGRSSPPDEQPLKPAVLRSVAAEIHRPAVESWGFVQEATTLSFR